ncbi:MAG: uroporphyrinogen-III C-methyltransferase [Polyangiaceae bacterium]
MAKGAATDWPRRGIAGKVWLVGAGPGAEDLLTVRAARVLRLADVVAYDELVSETILALVPRTSERIAVGRRAHGCRHHDQTVHPLVVERARQGHCVVRLKGGDPMVFGRGGEEAEALAAAGIEFEIVPGISAALGAAAAVGIPLTHRECASSVTFATAHAAGDNSRRDSQHATAKPSGTLVYYMGLERIDSTCVALIASGHPSNTPAAVVSRATLPDERTVVGTLTDIACRVRSAGLVTPAILLVGDVVSRRVAPSSCVRETDA